MAIDFKANQCQRSTTSDEFGLCDKENKTPAYISHDNNEPWNATVLNESQINVTFTAIDNCIDIFRPNGDMESRCDGMLTYPDNIVFVELKNQRANWISDGIEQLEATIDIYKDNENLMAVRKRRAVVANRKHPHFHEIENETMQKFFSKNKVRLHIGSTIKI
jgi:hypothetical protein